MMLADSMKGLIQGCSESTVRLNYRKLLRQGASEFAARKLAEKVAKDNAHLCSKSRRREIMAGNALKLMED